MLIDSHRGPIKYTDEDIYIENTYINIGNDGTDDYLVDILNLLDTNIGNLKDHLNGSPDRHDVSEITNAVSDLDFNEYTILAADSDNTPLPITINPSNFIGRDSTGGVVSLSISKAKTILNITSDDVSIPYTYVNIGNDGTNDNLSDILSLIDDIIITGPTSVTDGQMIRYDGTGGTKIQVCKNVFCDNSGKIVIGDSTSSAMLDIVQSSDVTGIEVNGIANRSGVLLQINEGTGTPTGNIFEINSNGGSGGDYLCFNELGNLKTLKADPWLNSDNNLFLGIGVCGAGNLVHGAGDEGYFNTAIGFQALYSNTTGHRNIAQGVYALYSNTTGYNNIAQGYRALYFNTTGTYNIAQGSHALYFNTTGHHNIAQGHFALYPNTTGNYNIAQGYQALYSNTIGYFNTAIGFQALYSNTTGHRNIAQGVYALKSNTTGYENVAQGYQALYSNTTGYTNVAQGYQALYSNTIGYFNTAIGFQALYSNTTGHRNIAQGYRALYFNTTGTYNTAQGFQALYSNTAGHDNIVQGYNSGYSLTTGSYNILIGNNVDFSAVDVNYELNIGNFLVGNMSSKVFGINETAPEAILEITHTEPYIILHNSTEEDIDAGRESKILAFGEQSGGEETTLGSIVFAHDGTSDDENGYIQLNINTGNNGDSPVQALKIDSTLLASFSGDVDIASGKVYKVNNTQVIGAQQAHIADADGTIEDITTKFNTLLSQLEAHGINASS